MPLSTSRLNEIFREHRRRVCLDDMFIRFVDMLTMPTTHMRVGGGRLLAARGGYLANGFGKTISGRMARDLPCECCCYQFS